MVGTLFSAIYDRFLADITDDMYMEYTPEDTIKELRRLLIGSLPKFEFPRVNLEDYVVDEGVKPADEVLDTDFVLGTIWNELGEEDTPLELIVELSYFNTELTTEEIYIISLLMREDWLQSQITSCENTRMKYSGSDYKFTSQANHLAKLLTLLKECQRQSFHFQRLYKRRKKDDNGRYKSTWSMFGPT